MTALVSPSTNPEPSDRWRWPIDPRRYDTAAAVRPAEKRAIAELGLVNLRRMARHDPDAPGWRAIRRLLRPLDDAAAALHELATSHRRRGRLDAAAVVLLRCAETGRSYWAWTSEEWAHLLGKDLQSFWASVPVWAEEAARPQLASHAFLLGGFADFYKLGSFGRLALAWRVFGRDAGDSPPYAQPPARTTSPTADAPPCGTSSLPSPARSATPSASTDSPRTSSGPP
ncbi:hypothetical protein [Streptomyces rapamycinicus]|uniref:Uncharacterized protein n=2 Tax=Streptomyces rapamycinicus TaxID=1226757 RepID=A0A3L8RD67_STRRN|nr:hypothetical protein [Streptomyces rapamycinicus]MBB4787011.1 hypothetical protein [Streptomyces rapamycinicus]RLV77541.1 hypothetical protein D3C57_104190 [Streptomyces rapamycinicus NRRL 5491]UTO67015.1 hypothetical protein LJB45_35020 [Streptomyces rapamycinicus]UTP34972.1 hypothetical protein LIV37_40155 [Streptomyces rapamycinicus NRRL 5491]